MREVLRRDGKIRRKVLVVDDEMINRRMLGFIVSRDYDVIYAENGREALELIRQESGAISLVLLDLLMPEMNGYELLRVLHEDRELHRIPVIVLTSEKDSEVESLNLGAVDFIPKPYDMPEVILARVGRAIELAEDNVIIHETENDELTGLYTKQFFFHYCELYDKYHPDEDKDALVLDVNRFHLVNELYGRAVGDNILRSIADILVSILTRQGGLASRADSDTFYVYLPHMENYEENFLNEMTAQLEKKEHARVNIRMGIFNHVDNQLNVEQRFDRAKQACDTQRGVYGSSVFYYNEKMHETELFNEQLISDMDRALQEKQFVVYYQPKYNISGAAPVLSSAEALIRWFHPEYGMVSPGVFVPLFEENGLIQKLDRYVWNEAAAQIKKWKDTYGKVVPVSVNVSRIDIYDPLLEQEMLEIIARNDLKPEEYLLEITESAYTDNSKQIVETVEKLRADGFRVEMDDFGSGYSSLNMLTTLPVDVLKMDMAFVRSISTNPKAMRLVELILGIAEFLKIPVVAEGVETEDQMRLLKEAGCDVIQGYYFSKPLPPEEFNRLIEAEIKA